MANNTNKNQNNQQIIHDLVDLFDSELGKGVLGHDVLQHWTDAGFNKQVKNGVAMASVKDGLQGIKTACEHFGLYAEPKPLPNNQGVRLVFKPLGTEGSGLTDKDFVNIEIHISEDGATVHNTMWSPEAVAYIRNQNGEYNIASALGIGLNDAAKNLYKEASALQTLLQKDKKEAYRQINRVINKSVSNVTAKAVGIYSPSAIKEDKDLSQKNVRTRRVESTEATKMHIDFAYAMNQAYKANASKLRGMSEKIFTRQIQQMIDQSRAYSDFTSFVNEVVRAQYATIYEGAWRDDLENFFKGFVGKIFQGGMTEGTQGKISFADPEVPMKILQKTGKKITQGLQLLPQHTKYSAGLKTVAQGRSNILTQQQRNLYNKKIARGEMSEKDMYKDVYAIAYATEEHFKQAYKAIEDAQKPGAKRSDAYKLVFGDKKLNKKQLAQIRMSALKGFGNDAIFMTPEMAAEMEEMQEDNLLEGGKLSYEQVEKYIRDILIGEHKHSIRKLKNQKGKKAVEKYQKAIDELKVLESGTVKAFTYDDQGNVTFNSHFKGADRILYKYLHKQYDIDSRTKIQNFKIVDGYLDDILVNRHRYNKNNIGRGGATGDERHMIQEIQSGFAALALLNAGYSVDDIFIDGDPKKGLSVAFIKDASEELADKNARTMIMGLAERITNYVEKHKDKFSQGQQDIDNYFDLTDKTGTKDRSKLNLSKYFKWEKDGTFTFNEPLFTKDFLNTGSKNKAYNNVTNLMKNFVGVGQRIGLLDKNKEYFRLDKLKGEDYWLQVDPLIFFEEMGMSSVPEYEGMGRATKSKVKYGWREDASAKGTTGKYQTFLKNNLDKYNYGTALKPWDEYQKRQSEKLQKLASEQYYSYARNSKFLAQTFMSNPEQLANFEKDMQDTVGVYILDINDVKDNLITDIIEYENDALQAGEELGIDAFLDGNILRKRNGEKKIKITDQKSLLASANTKTRISILQKEIQKKEYELLQKKYDEKIKQDPDYLNKEFGIQSANDIVVMLKDGDRVFQATIDGQEYLTKLLPLAVSDFSEAAAKEGKFLPTGEGTQYNERLVRTLLNPKGENWAKWGQKVVRSAYNGLIEVEKDYRSGNAYEKTHTLDDDISSGYLKLGALSENHAEWFREMAKRRGFNQDIQNRMANITGIMAVKDFSDMVEAKFGEGQEGRQEIFDAYKLITGKEWTGKRKGKKALEQITQSLVNALDINNDAYQGGVFSNLLLKSNPTINFANDALGGGFVLSSDSSFTPGTIFVDKYLAEIAKRDMDGDRVGVSWGLKSADFTSSKDVDAYMSYWANEIKSMKDIDDAEKKAAEELFQNLGYAVHRGGTKSKINGVTNDSKRKLTVASSWLSKKGAGIFGNLDFAVQAAVNSKLGLGPSNATGGIAGFAGTVLGAVAQTLYQEGISAKKITANSPALIATIQDMANQKNTWDNEEQTRIFFSYLKDLGIVKSNGAFKGNALQVLGLPNLLKDETAVQALIEELEQRKETASGDAAKQLKQDIRAIKNKNWDNLSVETTIAMLKLANDYVRSHTDNGSVGTIASNQYYEIPGSAGYNHEISGLARLADYTDPGATLRALKEGSHGRGATKFNPAFKSRIQEILDSKIIRGAGTTRNVGQFIINNQESDGLDPIFKLLDQYMKTEDEEELNKLQAKRDKKYSTLLKNNKAVLLALAGGTVSHKMSENLMAEGQFGLFNRNEAAAGEYFKQNYEEDYNKFKKQFEFLFPSLTEKEREQELNSFLYKGAGNWDYVANKIKDAEYGGGLVGKETPLAAFRATENGTTQWGRGTADVIYYTFDEDGRRVIHIGDYKNTKDGKLTLENMFQGLEYRDALYTLKNDVQAKQVSGGLNALSNFDAYLNLADDDKGKIAQVWKTRLEDAAFQALGYNSTANLSKKDIDAIKNTPEFKLAHDKAREQFGELYDVLRGDVSDIVVEFYSHGANGLLTEYTVNLRNNPLLQEKFKDYQKGSKSVDDFIIKYNPQSKSFEYGELYNTLVKSGALVTNQQFLGTHQEAVELFQGKMGNAQTLLENKNKLEVELAMLQSEEKALKRGPLSQETAAKLEENQRKQQEIQEKLGVDTQTRIDEIDKELEEVNKGFRKEKITDVEVSELQHKITTLLEAKDKLLATINGQLTKAMESLENESIKVGDQTILDGKQVAEKFKEEEDKKTQEQIKQITELSDYLNANKQLKEHNKQYKEVSSQLASVKAERESKVLSKGREEELDQLIEQLTTFKAQLDAAIAEELKLVSIGNKVGDGNIALNYADKLRKKGVSNKEAQVAGLYVDRMAITDQAQKKAEEDIAKREHQAITRWEQQAYQVETNKWKRVEEEQNLKDEINTATEKGDEKEIERLEKQLELVTRRNQLQSQLEKENLDNLIGRTEESAKLVKELTDTEHQIRENNKRKQQSGANQRGYGFLGIDAATTHWIQRMMSGGAVYTFIRMIRKGLRDITNMAKQLDQAMTNLRIVTGKNASDARTLIGQYSKLGQELGATTVEVTQTATAWLRQGYDIAQVNDLIKSSMYLSKLGMIDTTTATQNLTSAMHGFKLEASDAMSIVDKFTALDVKAATTAGDIAQGLSQFANIARLGGVSIDQAAAYVATIADVNQMSGVTVGQSLKTIMSRYGNVKAGAYNKLNVDSESNDTSEKLNDVERVLNKMGISIRKTNLEFKDFDEVLDEIADKWGTLDNVTKRALANAFAGVRQNEAFLVLMENYDKYQDLLKVSETSEGTAERKYQSYKESYAAAKNEFQAALEQFANSSEISKLLTGLIHIGTKFLEIFQRYIIPMAPAIVSLLVDLKAVKGKGLIGSFVKIIGKLKPEKVKEGTDQIDKAARATNFKLAAIDIGISTLASAVTQFATAATTHEFNGEQVESSKEAQRRGASVSAALSLIPFFGSIIGPWVAESIAQGIDKERDEIHAATNKANERLSRLQSLDTLLSQVSGTEQGSADRHKIVQELKEKIFDPDNKELQQQLQLHLGKENLFRVLDDIEKNTSGTEEALQKIQLAQLEAEKAQIYDKYATELYEKQQELNNVKSELDNFNTSFAGGGAFLGATSLGLGATAVLGTILSLLGGPMGLIIGATVAGTLLSGGAGAAARWAAQDAEKNNHNFSTAWEKLNGIDLIGQKDFLQERIDQAYAEGDDTLIRQLEKYLSLIEQQISIQQVIVDKLNDITMQEALVVANVNGKKLSNMSIEELKSMGIDNVIDVFAEALKKRGGIQGVNLYDTEGNLSQIGYEYLFNYLRKLGDEEITAVLSGDAYTLKEALAMPEGYTATKVLTAFSNALGVTENQLQGLIGKFGDLKLAEVSASTENLTKAINGYGDLIGSITSGSGSVSTWMENIISQYPDLIQYMGDTSELFRQITARMKQLVNVGVLEQGREILDNKEFFTANKEQFYASISENVGPDVLGLLQHTNPSSFSDVINWITSKSGTAEAEQVYNIMYALLKGKNIKVTNTDLKEHTDKLISYQNKLLDKQLANLEAQKESLKDINNQREYENKLIEARLKLEEASKQKKRVYRAGVGWVYEADQEAIASAQKELEDLDREKEASALEKQIELLQQQKEALNNIYENGNFEYLETLANVAADSGDWAKSVDTAVDKFKQSVDGLTSPLETIAEQLKGTALVNKNNAIAKAKEAWDAYNSDKIKVGTSEYNTALELYHKAYEEAIAAGAEEKDFADFSTVVHSGARNVAQGASARSVGGKSYEDQEMSYKVYFDLGDANDKYKRYQGYTYIGGQAPIASEEVQNALWNDVNGRNGHYSQIAYTNPETGETAVINSNDIMPKEGENFAAYLKRVSEELGVQQFVLMDPVGASEAVYYDRGAAYAMSNDNADEHTVNGLTTENFGGSSLTSEQISKFDDFAWRVYNEYRQGASSAWSLDSSAMTKYIKKTPMGDGLTAYKYYSPTNNNVVWFLKDDETGVIKDVYYGGRDNPFSLPTKTNIFAQEGSYAAGSLGISSGSMSLINELGTEAIVTPQGTITALPAKTGVVPADITKNLWELGEIAPSLLRMFGAHLSSGVIGKSIFDGIGSDESLNIANLVMNIDADSGFDLDKLVAAIRSKVALTKNSR